MELPKVRRWRKGEIDRLYIADGFDRDLGWAETISGQITVQVPGSEARIEAALENWAQLYPEDDLSTHPPGRHTEGLAAAWQAEVDDLERVIIELKGNRDSAAYQRDQYLKGQSGEERVGAELNKLHRDGWGILHSIPIFDAVADVDHLLIGPGGVWTVNAKAHPRTDIVIDGDRITIGRTAVDYVPSARREARMVHDMFKRAGEDVEVKGALVFDIPHGSTSRNVNLPADVKVLHREGAFAYFKSLAATLSAGDIQRIFAIARKSETWETPST